MTAPTLNLLFHLHHETEQERPSPRAYAEVLALIRRADTLPIGCAWLAEHHLSPPRGRLPAPLLMAVAAARETRRLRVGPCVLVVPLHGPLDLAEQIAVADLLTDGRLTVGLGSGGNPEEFAAFGVPLDERRGRFEEGTEIVARALRGEPFAYSGAHYQLPEVCLVPRPLQQIDDMLWLAAGSVAAARFAGQSGAHLLLARGVSVAELRAQAAAYHETRAERQCTATRRVQVTRGIYVAPSDERAWREAEQGVRAFMRATGRSDDDVDLRELGRRGDFIIGSPETCAAAIGALAQSVPITDLACDIFLPGMEHGRVERSLELLGQVAEHLGLIR